MKNIVGLLAIAGLLSASVAARADDECGHEAPPAPVKWDSQGITRGDKLPAEGGIQVEEVLKAPQSFDGKTVVVQGNVRKACSRMGCWMELAATPSSPGMRVTFKDHAFFVPTDSAGARARIQGLIKVADVSPEQAAHLKSEGAQVPQGADGKAREVQMIASGVELKRN